MNGVRPLALILAALAVCVALASMWPHLAGGQAPLPAEVVEGAVLQQDCVDDVSIQNLSVYDRGNGYVFKDSRNYADGDDIVIFYDVVNSSCQELTVAVDLTGSVSGAKIHDADGSTAPCLDGCTLAAGATQQSNVQWDLSKHPNAEGEKVVATVTVTAPDGFVDANPDNNTATSEQWINIVNEEPDPEPDISIKSVTPSVPETVVGDSIVFTVAIQNGGDADADADTTVTLDHGADTTTLASATVSALAVDGESTVTLEWDTNGAEAGEHTLRALAQTEGDGNADNDSKPVTVTLLQPTVDVAVKSVTASADEAVVGDMVDFTVALENDGNVAAVSPEVALFDADGAEDAVPLASVTAGTIAVGGTATVTISWDTDDAEAGTYSLRAVAAVAGDNDSTNDSATTTLTLHSPVNVGLIFTEPLPDTVVAGNPVSAGFTLSNVGEHDTGEVKVSLYVTAEGAAPEDPEPAAAKSVAAIAAGGSVTDSLTWDTADVAAGRYELEVVIQTIGDTDEANNAVSASVAIRNWLTIKDVSPTSVKAVAGDTVEFTAQVENVGRGELTAVTVGLYESKGNEALVSATIDSVAAGDTADATIQWDTAERDVGLVELFVIAGADGQDPDEDDSQSVNVIIRNPIALSSAVPASTDHISGIPVSISVEVLNESVAEVTNVAVKLDSVEDCQNKDREKQNGCAAIATIAAIPAGETGTTVLEWDTAGVEPGDHELKIIASAAGYGSDANDELPLAITLRAPVVDVALTGASINRNVAAVGQTLEVVATITNHGEAPVAAPVALYLVADDQGTMAAARETSPSIEPGTSAKVTLRWDSTGETVEKHTLKVAAELPQDTTDDDNENLIEIELFHSAFEGDDAPENCLEDVRVTVDGIRDKSGLTRSSPDYQVGEDLRVVYTVYNYSCDTDVAAAVTMTGPEGQAIHGAAALCFSDCTVPFGGKAEGEIVWVIPTLPALSDQPISASVTVVSPSDFADIDEANNSAESTDRMNIVHPEDVDLLLGEQNDNKVSTRQQLAEPDFGTVDVRLVSVNPMQTTLPFAAETVEVAVAAANDGPATEPAAVRFVLVPEGGTASRELYRHTMVLPAGQTKTDTVELPLRDVPPGVHTVEPLLTAAVSRSLENNAASVEITRMAPLVNVEMEDVAVSPDVLILGDDATMSLVVRNKSEIALPLSLELYVDDDAEPTGTKTIDELAPDGQSEESVAWRVPASLRMLGKHTLRLVASSEDFGAVANADTDVTFHIDAEILRINASPTETAMRGEEVAIEVEVQNNGPATVNVPVTLHFPSTAKNPETDHAPTPAGSTGTASFTWKTRDYAVGEHTFMAEVPVGHNVTTGQTSSDLSFQLTEMLVMASIANVTVTPEYPMVGEPVSIAVTVRNDGPVATRIPITLHFPPGGRQPDSKKPRLDPSETGTVFFEWFTGNYRPGPHRFRIELAAIDTPQHRFTIDLLPTVENVAIVGMGTHPVETAMVGEPVEVWIDVRNDGPVALNVPVRLTFPSAGKRPETQSPRVGPGETARVWFEWKTSNYEPGDHTLRAAILLSDNITVGPTTEEIKFALTPLIINATIVDIAVSPEAPRVGEPVSITVTVRNDGRIAANIPVTLHFPSSDTQPKTRRPRVAPGAVGSADFTWRTSRYEPGIHDFRVEVASDPPESQRFEVELLPPIVDVAIVRMGSDPSESAVRGQEVKIWVDVINNGPSALNVPVQLTFPSIEKEPERKSPRIEPGETARVWFEWKTSNYDPGIHTLTVELLAEYNATELEKSATIQIRLVSAQLMASIVDISWSPNSPAEGDPVAITVTVRNDGLVATNIPVTLYFPSEGKQPETRRSRVAPGAVGTTSFTWRTSRYEPGDHVFRAQIPGVAGAIREFEIELRPPIVNVAIVGMGTYPVETAMVGEPVEVWIDVRNDGPVAIRVPVRLTFPSDDKKPEQDSERIEAGEIARYSFTWRTSNYEPGTHTLQAAIPLHDNTTLGRTTDEIRFTLTPLIINATIVDVAVNPQEPRVGEPVTIAVAVRNDGRIPASIPVTLHFPSEGKQPETRRSRVTPGAVATTSFTWRTSHYEPGHHVFRVQIPGVPGAIREFEVELLPPIVDVAIVGIGSEPSETVVRGQAVKIWVDVINNGPSALDVPVQLTFPSSEKQPERKSPRIEPGTIERIEFTWKTSNYDPGIHTLTAELLAEHNTTELDTSATIQIRLVSAQLIASIVDISWSPDSPVVGDPVAITVTVRNNGPVTSSIPVTLHFPSADKQPETRRPRVAPGAVGTTSFTWRTSRYEPGDHVFRAQIPGVAGAIREFEIELRPPAVDFAVAEFRPPDPLHLIVKGDWVEITVVVQNQGPYAGRGTVYLLNAANLDTMYEQSASLEPGEFRNVEFTWKTLRYPVGEYDLLVRVEAEYDTDPDNDHSDPARVHLLTDRDITVGFGNNVRPTVFAEPTSEAALRVAPWYPNDIQIAGVDRFTIDRPMSPASESSIGVAPKPTAGKYDPSRMYWHWRSAQVSTWECARFQRTIGESLPRAVVCPKAPALVR
ncbi:MAG: hypothetical protein OXL37_19160 [Chloroflexota bacterium]|nr:hypothetical protein [Chloroflexota bacterium]MDE2958702.1 hypothetical protein [Chloroflexota bacterium]